MWRETTKYERNQQIFTEEFEAFLPAQILDFHVHILNAGVIPAGRTYSCAGHPIDRYDLKDLEQDLAELYPGRETAAVCFGFPEVAYDRDVNNAYLAEQCDHQRFFPFRLFDPVQDTPNRLREELIVGRFLGIKPYLDYVRKAEVNAVEIPEMLPGWAMDIANDTGLIVMLHIPRKGRLADSLNQQQLVELCTRYPKAKIVMAHVGRAYFMKNVAGQLDRLRELPNLYVDLAMVNHWEVLEYLFAQFPAARILYGTDIPIGLAPGKSVEINNQYTYVTPVPWALSVSDEHRKIVFTSFVYEELRAVKKAVERLSLPRQFVKDLFWNNGMALLKQAHTA